MSLKGSTTLINRVKRHILPSEKKKIHWHIDYLLEHELSYIHKIYLYPSSQRLECILAQELFIRSDGFIEKFGCSDCKCESHLLFFENFNELKDIMKNN